MGAKHIVSGAALLSLAVACSTSRGDGDVRDVTFNCRQGQPLPTDDSAGGHRVRGTWIGTNGAFVSSCQNGDLLTYECEAQGPPSCNGPDTGSVSHGGYCPQDFNRYMTGVVIPSRTAMCESWGIGAQCRDGACFYPPLPSEPRCPPSGPAIACTWWPPDVDNVEPLPDDWRCCSGGDLLHCPGSRRNILACETYGDRTGCVVASAHDDSCYGVPLGTQSAANK